jgi:hypothetical protein
MMNLNEYGRKKSHPNKGTILEFSYRGCGNNRKPQPG